MDKGIFILHLQRNERHEWICPLSEGVDKTGNYRGNLPEVDILLITQCFIELL